MSFHGTAGLYLAPSNPSDFRVAGAVMIGERVALLDAAPALAEMRSALPGRETVSWARELMGGNRIYCRKGEPE
jgi:hypothetical protein